MMIVKPEYIQKGNKYICNNATLVINSIKHCFPLETYQTLADRAGVHIQTILRWVSVGRAEENAMRRLILSFDEKDNYDTVLLKEATPAQLRRQCQLIGWDIVINSPKQGELFMKIQDAQKQIAEMLAVDDSWANILCNDCLPGIYGVEYWEAMVLPEFIWVDFPKMEFSFKNAEFDFEVRLGGSREEDSMDESHSRMANGTGKFECSGGRVVGIYDIEINCDLDLTDGGTITRV